MDDDVTNDGFVMERIPVQLSKSTQDALKRLETMPDIIFTTPIPAHLLGN